MIYPHITEATFIDRPNRFIAHVHVDGTPDDEVETVHVKNTGRCRELLIPGCRVVLSDEWINNPNRKTRYDLITVYKPTLGWINIDSQVPNKVMREWLESGHESVQKIFPDITYIKPEYTYGDSRVDFYLEANDTKVLVEVKGCTLEVDGVGYFPDAPTERGAKHLRELQGAVAKGFDSYIAFVIAMPGVESVYPNETTDPRFAKAFAQAKASGVKVLFLLCDVFENEIKFKNAVVSDN